LLKYFIMPALFAGVLYLPEFQPVTGLGFWAKETGTFKAVNSDFPLTKPPETSLFSTRKVYAV
jgi:hypothetical protein